MAILALDEPCGGERTPALGAMEGLDGVDVEVTDFLGLALRATRDALGFRDARVEVVETRDEVVEGAGAFERRLAAAVEDDGTTDMRFVTGGAKLVLVLAGPAETDGAPGLEDTEEGLGAGLAASFGCSRTSIEGRARINIP
jgi:hypothetical protein